MRLACFAVVVVLALVAAQVVAWGDTISSQTSGIPSGFFRYYGQGIYTGSGGSWTDIAFAFDSQQGAGFTPYAEGDLYLLSSEYAGTPTGLSDSTSGFIAQAAGISNGYWYFDSSVTLQSNTTYYFMMGDRASMDATRVYAMQNGSPPGHISADYANSAYSGNTNDLDHMLVSDFSSPVPEPTTLALFGLGAGALALRRRRRKLV